MSVQTLKDLLFAMLKIRRVEEAIVRLYPAQEMKCPVHLCIGQEAIPAGLCKSLNTEDLVFCSHRSHGYYVARGGDLKAFISELYGKLNGCSQGKGGSQHFSAPEVGILGSSAIVAGTIPIAVGTALSSLMQGKNIVTVVDFGDGATDEGVFYESLNFAALRKLPVVFICENNSYATHAHQSSRQAKDNIFQKARVFGVAGMRINGNDVQEVFKSCSKAVHSARKGQGPVLIECMTYRWMGHVGVNYDYRLGYRTKKELTEGMKNCPIKALKEVLFRKRILKKSDLLKMSEKIDSEIQEAVSFAKISPAPHYTELLRDVYRT